MQGNQEDARQGAVVKRETTMRVATCIVGGGVLLFTILVVMIKLPHWKASPPDTVEDISSFLAWRDLTDTWVRITVDGSIYYQVTGPSGSWLASGPSAYTLDEQGKFIDWTPDMWDIYRPSIAFSQAAQRESVSLAEIKATWLLES